MIEKCLFCGGNSTISQSQKSDGLFYDCEICGKYFAEERLETKLSEFSEEEKHIISNFLKGRAKNDFQKILTMEYLREIVGEK